MGRPYLLDQFSRHDYDFTLQNTYGLSLPLGRQS